MDAFPSNSVTALAEDDIAWDTIDAGPVEQWRRRNANRRQRLSRPEPVEDEPTVCSDSESLDGTWFDENLRLVGEPGKLLLTKVLEALEEVEKGSPKRRRRKGWKLDNFERRVECIVANALRAHFYRQSHRVCYLRGASFYRDKAEWLSAKSTPGTVDLLVKADLLTATTGQWIGNEAVKFQGNASTFSIGQKLSELIEQCAVWSQHVGKTPPPMTDLVRLMGPKNAAGKAEQLSFEATAETDGWAATLAAYNDFVTRFEIWPDLSETQSAAVAAGYEKKRREGDRQPAIKQPELFNRYLYRVFNDGTFDHGGRLYGAFWIDLPSWARPWILIEDEPTVELDYSGMSLRMIYHLRGIDYRDDPYEIPELMSYAAKQGHRENHYRHAVKTLVQAMINHEEEGGRPELVRLEETFRPGFTRAEVKALIERKHDPIADAFQTGEGKRNQRRDSDLALEIISNLMGKRILALPVHDSFIVQAAHGEELRKEMKEAYQRMLGFEPVIKQH